MLSKWQFNVLTAAGVMALCMVIFNAVMLTQNRDSQAKLAQRQQFIQQTVPLESLYREIAKALAESAIKSNDQQVLSMLSSQGLNVTVNTPSAASAQPVLPAKADK